MIEKVNPSHPDKVADRIAGAIVDLAYAAEPNPKIAVEVLIGHGQGHVIIETSAKLDKEDIAAAIYRIAGDIRSEKVTFNDVWQTMLDKAKKVDEIRNRREAECFPVVNRGQLWYDKLSKKKKEELEQWYQAWLDATNTGVVPAKPAWL